MTPHEREVQRLNALNRAGERTGEEVTDYPDACPEHTGTDMICGRCPKCERRECFRKLARRVDMRKKDLLEAILYATGVEEWEL